MPDAPEPIVILGTGRSFTSVVCCMIGQHPDLIGLPETNIFRDPTLGEFYERFSRPMNVRRRSGLLRTLAHFHDDEQTRETINAAERFVLEHQNWTSREIGEYIVKLAAPRGIVEKSISTGRDSESLARVREAWPNAYYLHITRQPEDFVHSMSSRISGAIDEGRGGFRLRSLLQTQKLDEYYTRFTTRILEFMATLPPGRGMNLHGELFLSDASFYLRQICEWVGLDVSDQAIEGMMHPENNPFATWGPENAPGGMSSTFLESPTYSARPLSVKPLTIVGSELEPNENRRTMALLGHRLGYT